MMCRSSIQFKGHIEFFTLKLDLFKEQCFYVPGPDPELVQRMLANVSFNEPPQKDVYLLKYVHTSIQPTTFSTRTEFTECSLNEFSTLQTLQISIPRLQDFI